MSEKAQRCFILASNEQFNWGCYEGFLPTPKIQVAKKSHQNSELEHWLLNNNRIKSRSLLVFQWKMNQHFQGKKKNNFPWKKSLSPVFHWKMIWSKNLDQFLTNNITSWTCINLCNISQPWGSEKPISSSVVLSSTKEPLLYTCRKSAYCNCL